MRFSEFLWVAIGSLFSISALGDNEIVDEIVITASPLGKTGDAISQPITALSGDALRTQAAATIGETLEGQAGITSTSFGPGVGAPVIRGQSGNRVRVLQDNIGTLDAATSSQDHSITVEPLLAKRIEVLRGPATLRYGSGAIGGVVNVIDNRIPDTLPEATAGALEYRHHGASGGNNTVMALEGAAGSIAWHLDGLYRDSDDLDIPGSPINETAEEHEDGEPVSGFIPNTDTQASSLTGGLSWIGERGFIGFSMSRLENNYGIPQGAHPHEDEAEELGETARIDMQQTRTDLKGELLDPFAGFEKLSVRLGYNDYRHTEIESGEEGTVFDSEALEGRLELIHNPAGNWRGALGFQGQHRDFAAIGEEAFIPASLIRSQGIFAVEEYSNGPWVLEFGLRAERQSINPDNGGTVHHNSFNFSTSTLLHLTENQHGAFTLTRAQRAPSVEELFSNGPHLATGGVDIGNPNLNVETGTNLDLGYHYHGLVIVNINLFYNRFNDFIYKRNSGLVDPDEALPIFNYVQEDAVFKGVEAELGLPLGDRFNLRLFADSVHAELTESNAHVPRITPRRAGIELSYDRENWYANLRVTEVAKQNRHGDFEAETNGYTKLDGHINYRIACGALDWLFFIRANNLLNEEIRNATSFLRDVAPEAGRSITAGFRLTF